VRALYRHDRRERLIAVNEWSGGLPPRFFLMRTAGGAVVRCRHDLADDLAIRLSELALAEPLSDPPTVTPRFVDRYLEALGATRFGAGPAFTFPSRPAAAPDVVAIDHANADLLLGGLEAWLPDVGRRGPFLVVVEAGRAVSLCASVRITRFVHCAGVETVPDRRGLGHAAHVVTAWAAAVRTLGAVPFYSTSWNNLASGAVARRLGLELAGVDFQVA
jgi:hypothetical protein